MAYDYAWVHVKYTIPLAGILTLIAYPFLNRTHVVQITALVIIAFTATVPWDSYLISHGVWTYPPDAIIGPKLYGIPAEELFFFVIQTYMTSLFYVLVNKPLLHAQYVTRTSPAGIRKAKIWGQAVLAALCVLGAALTAIGGIYTYTGLILVWSAPFALITWTIGGHFMLALPGRSIWMPIVLPTVYLWLVDELALGRGTWSIESGTKIGICLWGSLDFEEALFFLASNVLIVFGQGALDSGVAVADALPRLFPTTPVDLTPALLYRAQTAEILDEDVERIQGIREAVQRLKAKSRSFYLASATFNGRLRLDLVLLYSFCRMADDLVDEAKSTEETKMWIAKLRNYLDFVYSEPRPDLQQIKSHAVANFPASAISALTLLPSRHIPKDPLYELIDGFEMDLAFTNSGKGPSFPIEDEATLEKYGHCVASTVGELCLALAFHHDRGNNQPHAKQLRDCARRMGVALQYVNIARDIWVDAQIGRVYLPTTWLKEYGLTPEMVLANPQGETIERLRKRLLAAAFEIYRGARPEMVLLPRSCRGPMIAAIESYMEIGRVLSEKRDWKIKAGRATVPKPRRLRVALSSLFRG